jgi:hypothetical protein
MSLGVFRYSKNVGEPTGRNEPRRTEHWKLKAWKMNRKILLNVVKKLPVDTS